MLTRTGRKIGLITYTPASPEQAYRVRFPDGTEGAFHRAGLTLYRQQQDEMQSDITTGDLLQYVEYRCVVGSTAYGLANPKSDVDRRGFYLPPAHLHWSLAGVPEQLQTDREEVYWEIEKFIRLALRANPNVLECLYSPLVELASPIAEELLAVRQLFLSQHVHRTYNAYVFSQFKKLEQDLRNGHNLKWKHVMHLIRLLLSGITILKEGFVPLQTETHRDALLAIREGEMAWDQVESWRLALHAELDSALEGTKLPPHPDYERANHLLLAARRSAVTA